jgi:3-phenylpropionate/trans-cinnamate dioxygenase ferredoxin reductase subunit
MSPRHIVAVGGGQAGGEFVAALRSASFDGDVTLVGAETEYPYARPPLSKGFLRGETDHAGLLLRQPDMYERHGITVRLGRSVVAIDRARKVVRLDDNIELTYSELVLATGGRPRMLAVAGLGAARNVFTVRALHDVEALRVRFVPGARLVVIGGGYIGLELAAVARQNELGVTVLEACDRLLARVTSAPMSEFFRRVHTEEGVDVRTGVTATEFEIGDGEVRRVGLSDGTRLDVDVLVVGIGLIPETALAEAAGLQVDDGIVVDKYLRTSDLDIYAIGDVARFPDARSGGYRRLESVPNASEQARALAHTLTGAPQAFEALPWFWSDQYDVKLQVVGVSAADDDVVIRGDPSAGRRLTVFYLRKGEVCAADVACAPADFAMARRLVGAHAKPDPGLLADSSRPLRELVAPRP